MSRNNGAVWLAVLAFAVLFSPPSQAASEAPPESSLPSFRVTSLHQWVVDRMSMWSPPGISYVKDAKESAEEGKRRYEDIANAVIRVAYDPSEKPVFQGKNGRAMTAALMTSIAFMESAFRRDVDLGLGPLSRGDAGKSWCMMQVMMGKSGPSGRTPTRVFLTEDGGLKFVTDRSGLSGWGGEDLVADRTKCLRVGMRLARMSFAACAKLPVEERLSMYASGSCHAGADASRRRVHQAQRWLWKSRPPMTDSEAMELLHVDVKAPVGKEHVFGLVEGHGALVLSWYT